MRHVGAVIVCVNVEVRRYLVKRADNHGVHVGVLVTLRFPFTELILSFREGRLLSL